MAPDDRLRRCTVNTKPPTRQQVRGVLGYPAVARGMTVPGASNIVRVPWHVTALCHRISQAKNPSRGRGQFDRFRNPGRSQAIAEKVLKLGACRMHPGGKGTRHQAARRGVIVSAAQETRAQGLFFACPWVPKEYGWHGSGPARQRAVDGARESMRVRCDENTQGTDDASMMTISPWTEISEGKFSPPT